MTDTGVTFGKTLLHECGSMYREKCLKPWNIDNSSNRMAKEIMELPFFHSGFMKLSDDNEWGQTSVSEHFTLK